MEWQSPLSNADITKKIVAHWREHLKFPDGDERFIAHTEFGIFEDGHWQYTIDVYGSFESDAIPANAVYVELPNDLWPDCVDVLTPESQRGLDEIKNRPDVTNLIEEIKAL